MRAIGFQKNLPIDHPDALVAFEAPEPEVSEHDLLVKISAVSMNPADAKLRMMLPPLEDSHHILGYDAVGTVAEVGSAVNGFKPGDVVWYAGALGRSGTNAELHAVDHRIVSHAPKQNADPYEAAALPLTSLTAWEILFDRLALAEGGGEGQILLIVGGAGGVGSILIQLAKALTKLTVVATASRDETRAFVERLGTDHVIDHHADLAEQLESLGLAPNYIAGLTATEQHFAAYAEIIAPQGKIVLIDDPKSDAVDVTLLKPKSVSLHWEFMFTRSMLGTDDMAEQGRILARVAELVEQGTIRSTMSRWLGALTVDHLRRAHEMSESGQVIGKLVLGPVAIETIGEKS